MHTIGIVLTAHGELAPALLRAAELIVGPQPALLSVCLAASDSPETHSGQLEAALAQAEGGAGVLLLADLFGGTPSNIASLSLERADRAVLTGVNLPMLLEALMRRDELALPALAEAALQAGRSGIVDAGAMLNSSSVAARRRGDAA